MQRQGEVGARCVFSFKGSSALFVLRFGCLPVVGAVYYILRLQYTAGRISVKAAPVGFRHSVVAMPAAALDVEIFYISFN